MKCLAFEIKENTENIAKYRRKKKLVSSLFLILIIFLFSAKMWWGRGPTSPSPSAVPFIDSDFHRGAETILNFCLSIW